MVWKAQEVDESFDIDREMLVDLVKRAGVRAENMHLWDAKRGAQDLLDAHVAHQRQTRRKTFDELVEADTTARVEMVGTAKRARWPTRLGKKLHIAGTDLALRELAERKERDRWIEEIWSTVKAAKLPVALRSSDEALMLRVAKRRRPNTLRKHVKAWQKASRWFFATYGVARTSGAICGVSGGNGSGAVFEMLSRVHLQDPHVPGARRRSAGGQADVQSTFR